MESKPTAPITVTTVTPPPPPTVARCATRISTLPSTLVLLLEEVVNVARLHNFVERMHGTTPAPGSQPIYLNIDTWTIGQLYGDMCIYKNVLGKLWAIGRRVPHHGYYVNCVDSTLKILNDVSEGRKEEEYKCTMATLETFLKVRARIDGWGTWRRKDGRKGKYHGLPVRG